MSPPEMITHIMASPLASALLCLATMSCTTVSCDGGHGGLLLKGKGYWFIGWFSC